VKLYSSDPSQTGILKYLHPLFKDLIRVQHITALGVTLSYNFSMAKHIDTVMSSCARTSYTLWATNTSSPWCPIFVTPQAALQLVFRSTALAKLLYAAPAWWGFTNAGDRNRLEGLLRRAQKAGYYNNDSLPTVAAHCDQADEQLFSNYNNYNTVTSTLCTDFFHLSAMRHMAPDPVPITIISHKNSPASMYVIICFMCYINTVSRLAIKLFFINMYATVVCLYA